MREKDLKIDSFVVTCMNNIYGDDAEVNNEWYLECLNKAKDTKEFEKLYLSTKDNNIICSQAYGELLKKQSLFYEGYDKYYHYVMNKAEIKKVTCSDRGGLKLGNDTFSICVSNGYGDGVFTTSIKRKLKELIEEINHYYGDDSTVPKDIFDLVQEINEKIKDLEYESEDYYI